MTAVAPYKNSHVPRGRQASRSNYQLAGVSIPWKMLPTGIGHQFDLATGAAAIIGTLTAQDVDVFAVYDDSADTLTDDTTDANDAGTADVLFMPATEEDELDYALWGSDNPIIGLETVLSTAGVGGTVAFEYLNDKGVWTAMPLVYDESAGLTAGTSTYQTMFQLPEDWAPQILDAVTTMLSEAEKARYYVRARVTSVYSTNPVGTTAKVFNILPGGATLCPIAPADGVVKTLQYYAGTASGANNDTIIQFINHTKGTRGLVTLTQAVKNGRVDFTYPFYVEQGDEITATVLQEDGTTEFQDIEIQLEIAI